MDEIPTTKSSRQSHRQDNTATDEYNRSSLPPSQWAKESGIREDMEYSDPHLPLREEIYSRTFHNHKGGKFVRYLDIKLAAKQAQRGFMTNCSTYASKASSSLLAVLENNTTSLGSWFPSLAKKDQIVAGSPSNRSDARGEEIVAMRDVSKTLWLRDADVALMGEGEKPWPCHW
ncbi:unnamed protein product [Sphagnum troendelagicum]